MKTPAFLFRVISLPPVRIAAGWDIVKHNVRWISPEPDMVCLEIGAGGGYFSTGVRRHLGPGSTVITLDLSDVVMRSLVHRSLAKVGPDDDAAAIAGIAADGARIPFADDSIDCVFYSYSIEELPDPNASLEEALRVLRPGGQLVLFLWRPGTRSAKRTRLLAGLDGRVSRPVTSSGPQNIRIACRKLPAGRQARRTGDAVFSAR